MDGAEVRELETRAERQIFVAVCLGECGRVLKQRLQRGALVREGLQELGDGPGRALLVNDEPELRAGIVGVVGEAMQRQIGEGVRAQDDQLADLLGMQVDVDEPPQRLAARLEVERLAKRGEQAASQAVGAASGRRLADDLAERPCVQAA